MQVDTIKALHKDLASTSKKNQPMASLYECTIPVSLQSLMRQTNQEKLVPLNKMYPLNMVFAVLTEVQLLHIPSQHQNS